MIQTIGKQRVAAVAPTTTRRMNPASTRFNMTRSSRVITTMLGHLEATRYPAVFACILTGCGFAGAENFIPASVVAGLGLLLAAGPEAFYHWLHSVREAEDRALDGYEPDGHYTGDGIPRDQGGRPFEPLDWSRLKNRGSHECHR